MAEITIEQLQDMDDFMATVPLQYAIWEMPPESASSPYTMNAVSHNGGAVHGAKVDGKLVGFSFAFASRRGDAWMLWSHMAGVHPDYQGQGIGYTLKQVQRKWALENGYQVIGWTFDPLQRGNASFNFHRLGTIARTYKPNTHGEMTDGINAGLASDRLEALWLLESAHVVALAQPDADITEDTGDYPDAWFAVRCDGEKSLITADLDSDDDHPYCIEIPYNLNQLKRDDLAFAAEWQLAIRHAMLHLLGQGCIVSDVVKRDRRCWYVLRRRAED